MINGAGGFVLPATTPADPNIVLVSELRTNEGGQPNNGKMLLYLGTDQANGSVTWQPVETAAGQPLVITPNTSVFQDAGGQLQNTDSDHVFGGQGKFLPLPGQERRQFVGPNIAGDPVDPNRWYLVYHDLTTLSPDPNVVPPTYTDLDVDVFCRRLTRQASGFWTVGPPVRVNDDPVQPNPADPNDRSDQFLPALWVNRHNNQTYIHVAFYDDRNHSGQLDTIPGGPLNKNTKFDAYYAVSADGGLTFNDPLFPNQELRQVPAEPGARYELVPFSANDQPLFSLTDYIGLSGRSEGGGFELFAVFMGTRDAQVQSPAHKSVIFSGRIPWIP